MSHFILIAIDSTVEFRAPPLPPLPIPASLYIRSLSLSSLIQVLQWWKVSIVAMHKTHHGVTRHCQPQSAAEGQ